MATKINGLTRLQCNLLKKKFGYEDYPSGEHGFPTKAVEWMIANFPAEMDKGYKYRGTPAAAGRYDIDRVYFTTKMIAELESNAAIKGGR